MTEMLDNIKETIEDHPTETAVAVGVVAVLGTAFFYRRKVKKTEERIERANIPKEPNWFERWMIRRHEYKLARLQISS